MTYRIEFTKRANKQFQALPKQIQGRIAPKIESLAEEPRPHGAVKLVNEEGLYRVPVGDYRVVYFVEDEKVRVLAVRVDHRRNVHR